MTYCISSFEEYFLNTQDVFKQRVLRSIVYDQSNHGSQTPTVSIKKDRGEIHVRNDGQFHFEIDLFSGSFNVGHYFKRELDLTDLSAKIPNESVYYLVLAPIKTSLPSKYAVEVMSCMDFYGKNTHYQEEAAEALALQFMRQFKDFFKAQWLIKRMISCTPPYVFFEREAIGMALNNFNITLESEDISNQLQALEELVKDNAEADTLFMPDQRELFNNIKSTNPFAPPSIKMVSDDSPIEATLPNITSSWALKPPETVFDVIKRYEYEKRYENSTKTIVDNHRK